MSKKTVSAWLCSAFVWLAVSLLSPAGIAAPAPNDKEAEALVKSVLETEYFNTKFAEALEKLELTKQACAGTACSPKVRAKVYIAIGTVLTAIKQTDEAKNAFAAALKEDPTAALFSDTITPETQKAFNEARGVASASSGSTESIKKGTQPRKPKKTYAGSGRPPKGWKSAEAAFFFVEAQKSEADREWLDCADYAQASLAAENRAATRFVAAGCEERAGLWIEALADYRVVAETGTKLGLSGAAEKAKAQVEALSPKIPKIILRKPARATGLVVKMNDQVIPEDKLNGEIWVNPGQRAVSAKGTVDGQVLEFEQVVDVNEFETATVDIKLGQKGRRDTQMMKCLLAAQTRDDFQKCLGPSKGSSLNLRFGSEFSVYHDSDHVDVVTPALSASVESPVGGFGVGASMLVDVVSAASVDVVANASPRFGEVRYAPTLGGHKKFGDVDVSLSGALSSEPDYLATSIGGGVSVDLRQRTITPSLKYTFSYDVSGRAGTPFSVFSHTITGHGLDVATTFVVDRSTLLSVSLTAAFQDGDTSKPYRYIPMFTQAIARQVPAGLASDSVNQVRLPVRPLEQLPLHRQRYALSGLVAHRFTSSTLRAEERLYTDNWGLKASTTDAQYLIDVAKEIRVWPRVRLHAQTGTSFWQLAYPAAQKPDGSFVLPALRAGDRELGPLVAITGGGGARYAFGEKKNFALSLTGDVVYTRFLDTLYILQRIGVLGATSFEVELE